MVYKNRVKNWIHCRFVSIIQTNYSRGKLTVKTKKLSSQILQIKIALGLTYFVYVIQVVFDAMDSDKDGVVSLTEFQYASMNFLMCSGPESPFSYWFGYLVD